MFSCDFTFVLVVMTELQAFLRLELGIGIVFFICFSNFLLFHQSGVHIQ
uniref:WRKY transcription factor 21 n=1 Tax=Rhizophora mucronata TaxID=61149 RepID=A0A2P2LKY6_RHIMU